MELWPPADPMLDLAGVGNALLGGITDVIFIREGLVDADVNAFVDGGRNKKSCQTFRNKTADRILEVVPVI